MRRNWPRSPARFTRCNCGACRAERQIGADNKTSRGAESAPAPSGVPLHLAHVSALQQLADRIVVADAAYAILRRSQHGEIVETIIAAHDHAMIGILQEAVAHPLPETHPSVRVIGAGAYCAWPHVDLKTIGVSAFSDQHYKALKALNVLSQMTVPIFSPDHEVAGTITMLSRRHRYSLATLKVAGQYAHEAERIIARQWIALRKTVRGIAAREAAPPVGK